MPDGGGVNIIEARATAALAVVFGVVGVVAAVLGIAWLGIVSVVLLSALLARTVRLLLDREEPETPAHDVPRVPASADPDVVMASLLEAARAAGEPVAASLCLARAEAETARSLLDAARELTRRLDPGEVVTRSLDRAMKLSRAATGSIMLVDPVSGHMRIAASKGLPSEVVETTEVSEGEGIAGWVLSTGQ